MTVSWVPAVSVHLCQNKRQTILCVDITGGIKIKLNQYFPKAWPQAMKIMSFFRKYIFKILNGETQLVVHNVHAAVWGFTFHFVTVCWIIFTENSIIRGESDLDNSQCGVYCKKNENLNLYQHQKTYSS